MEERKGVGEEVEVFTRAGETVADDREICGVTTHRFAGYEQRSEPFHTDAGVAMLIGKRKHGSVPGCYHIHLHAPYGSRRIIIQLITIVQEYCFSLRRNSSPGSLVLIARAPAGERRGRAGNHGGRGTPMIPEPRRALHGLPVPECCHPQGITQ